MEMKRSSGRLSPFIFDGQGRLFLNDGQVILDDEGVRFASGELYRVSRADFEILEELGAGQYGTVWSVRHLPTNTPMAIKVVKLSVTEAAAKQIFTELDILVRSKSPFIVKCYGAFYSEASINFCMELLEEGSVEAVCRVHPLIPGPDAENVLRAIAFSVIEGLKFLRESISVIHRDIKPSNILIGNDGCVKICDFGISGYLAKSLARTRVGTSSYMAPERISLGGDERTGGDGGGGGGGGGYGVKADVWSLGATLMELATGLPPFPLSKYDCVFAQLMDIIHSDAPKLSRDGLFSEDFCSFVDSCLLKDPKDRSSYAKLLEHPFLAGMTIDIVQSIIRNWINETKGN